MQQLAVETGPDASDTAVAASPHPEEAVFLPSQTAETTEFPAVDFTNEEGPDITANAEVEMADEFPAIAGVDEANGLPSNAVAEATTPGEIIWLTGEVPLPIAQGAEADEQTMPESDESADFSVVEGPDGADKSVEMAVEVEVPAVRHLGSVLLAAELQQVPPPRLEDFLRVKPGGPPQESTVQPNEEIIASSAVFMAALETSVLQKQEESPELTAELTALLEVVKAPETEQIETALRRLLDCLGLDSGPENLNPLLDLLAESKAIAASAADPPAETTPDIMHEHKILMLDKVGQLADRAENLWYQLLGKLALAPPSA